jgi:glycogen synthase
MRILMLGWEFPPRIAGGLGVACHGLTRALDRLGHTVHFVMPDPLGDGVPATRPGFAHAQFVSLPAGLADPYATGSRADSRYGHDLIAAAQRYAGLVTGGPGRGEFDVLHAHDWLTFPAGLALASVTGRPLVAHIHSTESDRAGGLPSGSLGRAAADIEGLAVRAADRVIAVSGVTRAACIDRYGADPAKVEIVHNGIDGRDRPPAPERRAGASDRVVLFLGRIVAQKGPAYFLRAAHRVMSRAPGSLGAVKFVMAGDGDQHRAMQDLAAELGIAGMIDFPGFLRGPAVAKALAGADVLVMTSLAEPFGLAAAEAVKHGVPVILPPWAGAAEVLTQAPTCDPADTEALAGLIMQLLSRPHDSAVGVGAMQAELRPYTWRRAAERCVRVYEHAARERSAALTRP